MLIFFINSSLIGILLFFSIILSPLIFKTLEKKDSSKLIRKIFPLLFVTGILISIITLIISLINNLENIIILSLINLIIFIVNLIYFVPKINKISDIKTYNEKEKKFKFIFFHSLSVMLYIISVLISILIITRRSLYNI